EECAQAKLPTDLHLVKAHATETSGHEVDITTLRDTAWLDKWGIHKGAHVHLDAQEMGYGGDVLVLDVEDDVHIADGPGCVVMTMSSQADASVQELRFDGTAEPVHATAPHPFFSLDRNDWVAASELAIGEQVRTRQGTTSLASSVPLVGTHTVYNF